MLAYLNQLPNDYRDMINIGLINKEFDKPLEDYIVDALH